MVKKKEINLSSKTDNFFSPSKDDCMLSLNNEKIKQSLEKLQKKYNKSIDLINENIENLKNFIIF